MLFLYACFYTGFSLLRVIPPCSNALHARACLVTRYKDTTVTLITQIFLVRGSREKRSWIQYPGSGRPRGGVPKSKILMTICEGPGIQMASEMSSGSRIQNPKVGSFLSRENSLGQVVYWIHAPVH